MGILEQIGTVTTRVLLAFLVFTFGTIIASTVKRLVKKGMHKANINRALALLNYPYDLEQITSVLAFYLVYIIAALIALWLLGIASLVVTLVIILIATLLVLSIASFSKDLLPNLLGWYTLKHKKKIKVGNKIKLSKIQGKVKKIKFIETLIENRSGDLLHVPNVLFLEKKND